MSPTLLEGLLFLLLAALLSAYIGVLVFVWWPGRRKSGAEDHAAAPLVPGAKEAGAPRSTNAAGEGDQDHVR